MLALSGVIPVTFGNLLKLRPLYLQGNNLAGEPPPSIFEGLVQVHSQHGITSIPYVLFKIWVF